MAKDILQIEGDLHVLQENMRLIEHNIYEKIKDIGKQISDVNAANYSKTYQEIIELHEKNKREENAKVNLLLRRIEKLEVCFNEDCFQKLWQDLNNLKKEYHKKALKLVHKHSNVTED